MTKYYDIYTQIPGIKPCPQMWITAEDKIDIIDQFLRKRDFIDIHDIVGTDVKELSDAKTLICRKEYFACMVESQYEGEHMNKEKRTTKQVAKNRFKRNHNDQLFKPSRIHYLVGLGSTRSRF